MSYGINWPTVHCCCEQGKVFWTFFCKDTYFRKLGIILKKVLLANEVDVILMCVCVVDSMPFGHRYT